MSIQLQKSGGAAAARNKTDAPKPGKGTKPNLRNKSFAEGEAALKPGGAVDASRAPKSGGAHCDPLGDDYVEYMYIEEAATNMGMKMPSIAEWSKMNDKQKQNYRDLLDGPLTHDDPPDRDAVAKMYAEQGLQLGQ